MLETEPADARRQPLELNAFARQIQPAVQVLVVRDELLHFAVGLVDVIGVARERHPAKRAYAAAKQRADVRGHEAREIEGAFFARSEEHTSELQSQSNLVCRLLLEKK